MPAYRTRITWTRSPTEKTFIPLAAKTMSRNLCSSTVLTRRRRALTSYLAACPQTSISTSSSLNGCVTLCGTGCSSPKASVKAGCRRQERSALGVGSLVDIRITALPQQDRNVRQSKPYARSNPLVTPLPFVYRQKCRR